jgi:peptide/nickel transport system permease protein
MSQAEKELVDAGPIELGDQIKARGYWEQVWTRFKRDRLAIGGGITIIVLLLGAFIGAPIAKHLLGHGPNDPFFIGGIGANGEPIGPLAHIPDPFHPGHKTWLFLGADSTLGRDEFLRILYGAQASFEVALLSTFGAVSIGVFLGSIAGFFRGWVDTVVSRVTEITMAFPLLLFIIALAATVGPRLNSVTLGIFGHGVVTLILIFTIFGWYYPARIMRAQVLSIREKEYVEAARMIGASDLRIIRSHVLPHLVAPMLVYSTLIVASYVLFEAGLSFLGLGVDPTTTPSWGNLLADAPRYYTAQPWLMLWPGLAVLLTTLAFNLLGDGLRDAFDPRATQQN